MPDLTSSSLPKGKLRGVVKEVTSGDSLVVRGTPKGGPPPEYQISLDYVKAPRMERRPRQGQENGPDAKDEPYAWESREFLRKTLVGQPLEFELVRTIPNSKRTVGNVWFKGTNVSLMAVKEGTCTVREGKLSGDLVDELQAAQAEAASDNKGVHSPEAEKAVRDIQWSIGNPKGFLDKKKGKEGVPCIVEQVRDANMYRVFLMPSFQYITLQLTGIKAQSIRREGDKDVAEPFAEEAKFFVESRVLQRDLRVRLEGLSGQDMFMGTLIHPAGNISTLLLQEGFAKVADWSIAMLTEGRDSYRGAESAAKGGKKRIWKNYDAATAQSSTAGLSEKKYQGRVVEIYSPEAIGVLHGSGDIRRVHLSSLRQVKSKPGEEKSDEPQQKGGLSIHLTNPWIHDAREYIRKKLIGKPVTVEIDYIKPANEGYPEKVCATVKQGTLNVAEALIARGVASPVRHRKDDIERSSCYDDLLAAEHRAQEQKKGIYSNKDPGVLRINDLGRDLNKAKQMLPFLQRGGKHSGVVEMCISASRFRILLTKDNNLITLVLAGIQTPRGARSANEEGEPYSKEALTYAKSLCSQMDVEVEIVGVDRGGAFMGVLSVGGQNLSIELVKAGYASVVPRAAEDLGFSHDLFRAEDTAREQKLNIWLNYSEQPVEEVKEEPAERTVNYKEVIVSEVAGPHRLWVQETRNVKDLESLMGKLNGAVKAAAPVSAASGALVAAKFVDDAWYRAKILKKDGDKCTVLYVDYGNTETVGSDRLAPLPDGCGTLAPCASEQYLAFLVPPEDDDYYAEGLQVLRGAFTNARCQMNTEYSANGHSYVTLKEAGGQGRDAGMFVVGQGGARVEQRRERRLQDLLKTYVAAEEQALKAHRGIWEYGDFIGDEA
eukprot:Clim_evm42s136 gene=Clim_evmTU42s136